MKSNIFNVRYINYITNLTLKLNCILNKSLINRKFSFSNISKNHIFNIFD